MAYEKQRCPTCGRITSEREITLYRGLIQALFRVFMWAGKKGIHEFSRKDIKHLFANENDTARFGDLVFFGGLVYKPRKGRYGLNLERCEAFFDGRYEIPIVVIKNPVTGEIRKEDYRPIGGIPSILELLDQDMEYVARYRKAENAPKML